MICKLRVLFSKKLQILRFIWKYFRKILENHLRIILVYYFQIFYNFVFIFKKYIEIKLYPN